MREHLPWFLFAMLVVTPALGHPHVEREIVVFTGTVTKVDGANRTIEMDTIDPRTKQPRNYLLFLDKKAKLRHGKVRLAIDELKPGQRLICTAELRHDGADDERWIASECS